MPSRSPAFSPALRLLAVALLSLLLAPGCSGNRQPPARSGPVNDLAGLLSPAAAAALAGSLEDYEKETCHPFTVLIVPSLDGEPIAAFSARVMRSWGLDRKPLDNGLLLNLAVKEGAARVDAGEGLGEMIRSGAPEKILRSEMFPLFAQERFEEGIRRGLESLMAEGRKISYAEELRPAVCR